MSQAQITFRDVVKRFGDSVAVESINLEIQSGEFLAIMGSSGCGKTTTLRMLAGLETPSEGEICLNGARINELKPSERETPMVWQSLALFPFLNVIRNVEFGLKTRGVPAAERRQRALKWLQRMEIDEFAERSIDQLSGGQKQRVALARALVTEPPVLLLDEPLSALDANLVIRMQGVLSRLQKELGITFVYVTHSQSEAFAMADRVVIMSQGKIEQIGTPQQVFRQPASRFVAEFVGSNNILQGRIAKTSSSVLEIETEIGMVEALPSTDCVLNEGDNVTLVVSADLLSLSTTEPETPNRYPCSVISEAFVGSIISLLVEAQNGTELKVQKQQRELDQLNIHSGDSLWIAWQKESVYILPAEQSS
jgi:spermidine/putrescine transport system ATP-binding protein